MKRFSIAVLPGDGIGPEVIAQAVRVLEAVGERFDIEALTNGLEDAHCLRDDLRPDAVAGKNSDGESFHECSLSYSAMRGSSSRVRSISSRPRSRSSRR